MHEPERVEQLEYVVSQMHPDDQLELHRRICRIATALYHEKYRDRMKAGNAQRRVRRKPAAPP